MNSKLQSALTLLTIVAATTALAGCTRAEKTAPEEAATTKPSNGDLVTLTPQAVERFKIQTVAVGSHADNQPISTTGEIKPDENRVFHINSLTSGRVINDNAMLGDTIRSGQTLALVQNLDVAKIYGDYIHQAHQNEVDLEMAKTKLALATKDYDRLKTLYDEQVAAKKDVIKAETDKKLAEESVHGLQEHGTHIRAEAKSLLDAYGVQLGDPHSEHIQSTSPITTPRGGVIIKKTVTVGDVVSNSEPLYVVADLTHVWLDINVYDQQLQRIQVGDAVSFASDTLPGKTFSGRIDYIKPSTEGSSGAFVARAVLDNPGTTLKPGMLGQVRVFKHDADSKPFVPDTAVQKYGNETFVFLDTGNGAYKKQTVSIGAPIDGGYLVKSGLNVGDKVVAEGSFTLKAELLKSTLAEQD